MIEDGGGQQRGFEGRFALRQPTGRKWVQSCLPPPVMGTTAIPRISNPGHPATHLRQMQQSGLSQWASATVLPLGKRAILTSGKFERGAGS